MKVILKHPLLNLEHALDITKEDCISNKTFYWAILKSGLQGSALLFPLERLRKETLEEFKRRETKDETECIACKYSGVDEAEFVAYGCPACICGRAI